MTNLQKNVLALPFYINSLQTTNGTYKRPILVGQQIDPRSYHYNIHTQKSNPHLMDINIDISIDDYYDDSYHPFKHLRMLPDLPRTSLNVPDKYSQGTIFVVFERPIDIVSNPNPLQRYS